MYGSAIVEIQIDMFDGNSYIPIFNKIGDQGDQWIEENVFLNTISNYIHFRITGILSVDANGDTWPGDIAFDEFSVIEGVGDDLETINGYANSACDLSNAEIVTIEIVNPGAAPQNNFDVSYTINNGSPVIETFTSTVTPGDTVMYNFITTADLSTDGVYNIDYECLLLNDQNTSNNLFSGINENFVSPNPPVTIDDTICLGDTAFLEATTNQGLINWYSDPNGTASISTNAVTPNITTTFYAEVQASNFYKDDFESYLAGNLIAQSSLNWSTWSGFGGGQDDAVISNSQAASGNNSIWLNYLNDDDLYLPFDQIYTSGNIEVVLDMFVVSNADLNIQDDLAVNSTEILDLNFSNSGMLQINIGGTLLIGSYPGLNQWFELKITGDLSSSIWGIYINGAYQGGTVATNGEAVGSINFLPEIGDEYYIDNVEWYVITDDDCISGLSPLTVTVEDCSSIGENITHDFELYPNPTSDQINVKSEYEILNLSITDIMGNRVKLIPNTKQKNLQIDISDLSDGHYNIKIETKGFVVFKSFLITK